jgi:hypothetical protein
MVINVCHRLLPPIKGMCPRCALRLGQPWTHQCQRLMRSRLFRPLPGHSQSNKSSTMIQAWKRCVSATRDAAGM